MITRHAELLEQIRTARDDAPYHVYADLVEQGGDQPRAMLIRYQCDQARLPRWHHRHRELAWEIDDLLVQHGARWRAELPALDGIEWAAFTRGFVSSVRVRDVAALYRHALAIATAAPVTCVELATIGERDEPPASGIPWLRCVRLVDLRKAQFHATRSLLSLPPEIELRELDEYDASNDLLAAIRRRRTTPLERLVVTGDHILGARIGRSLERRETTELRELRLGTRFVDEDTGYFGDPTLRVRGALALAECIASVEALDVGRQLVTDRGFTALIEGAPRLRELGARAGEIRALDCLAEPHGAALAALDLGENAIGDAGAAALACARRLEALESLDLDRCEIGAAGVTALVDAPFWHTLLRLDLAENPLGVESALALAVAPPPERLAMLGLANADLTTEATALLADAPWLRRLRAIDLSMNEVAPSLLEAIAAGEARDVGLARCSLRPSAAAALAGLFPRVQHLRLADNPLRDAGFAAFAGDGELATLDLRRCELGDAALRRLATVQWPRLRSLYLSKNAFTRDGIAALVRSPLLTTLRRLGLASCGLDDTVASLLAASPELAGLEYLTIGGQTFSEASLLAIARSPHLRSIATLLVDTRAQLSRATAGELEERFGRGWQYRVAYDDVLEYDREDD